MGRGSGEWGFLSKKVRGGYWFGCAERGAKRGRGLARSVKSWGSCSYLERGGGGRSLG